MGPAATTPTWVVRIPKRAIRQGIGRPGAGFERPVLAKLGERVVGAPAMSDPPRPPLSKRAQRIHDAVLEIDGVVGVRVWELPDRVEIGVVASQGSPATDVLRRVTEVTDSMRSPDETWDVGLLTES